MRAFALLALAAPALAVPVSRTTSFSTFTSHTIFSPPSTWTVPRVLYPRQVQLSDYSILATWENYSPEPPLVYYPIYRSTDGGETFTWISNITDQVNGYGMRYQPTLYELPSAFAGYAKGTILCAGNSIPTNLSSTQIDLYASTDKGYTWEFVSHIAAGGEAEPTNGLTPVWEPFLMLYEDQMVVYYSDQRDSAHGQKLVHQTSSDLVNWDDVVDDVSYYTYTARPGMPTVAELPSGDFIMTYEYGGAPTMSGYHFPIFYKIASNPLKFNDSVGIQLNTTSSHIVPTSSPYVVWTSVGGDNGTIVVSADSHSQVFVNKKLGDENSWYRVTSPEGRSYSRYIQTMRDNSAHLMLMGAGVSASSTNNKVSCSVMDIESAVEDL